MPILRKSPYDLGPAPTKYFVGRDDLLDLWRKRLTEGSQLWVNGENWLLLAPGGMGKTSLLARMAEQAAAEHKAKPIWIDLGYLHDLRSPGDLRQVLVDGQPPARKLGSRARGWLGLRADASASELGKALIARLLEVVAGSVSHADWGGFGVELDVPVKSSSRAETTGVVAPLAEELSQFSLLSEEQRVPVVVLVDQVGKVHDDSQWLAIARILVDLAETMRREGTTNVVFVLSMRPERRGRLEYDLRQSLENESLFKCHFLSKFTSEEAVEAISRRGAGTMPAPLPQWIVDVVKDGDTVDPYLAQLGGLAVWKHLYGGARQLSPGNLNRDDVIDLVRRPSLR
jgi:hypothetical protein